MIDELKMANHLYRVEDDDGDLYIIADSFNKAIERWKRKIASDYEVTPDFNTFQPKCVRLVATKDELITQEIKIEVDPAIKMIADERESQKQKWSNDHDDTHQNCELPLIAIDLLMHVYVKSLPANSNLPEPDDHWGLAKKHPDQIDKLKIAAALIAAEISRLLRIRGE